MFETILIVDDEPSQLRMTEEVIQQKLRYRTITADSGAKAIEWVLSGKQPQPDLLLIGLTMPDMDGLHVIREVRNSKPQLPIIVFTSYGDDEKLAHAIQAGANDFLTKPMVTERLRITLQNALKMRSMSDYISHLEHHAENHVAFSDIVGGQGGLKEAIGLARQAADAKMPVWIEGERGTGKEMLARAIHGSGDRSGKPFVCVNCAALPKESGEALLFGQGLASGKMREASGGTLLLKDIDTLPHGLQNRLLNLLEHRSVHAEETAGSTGARIICTTIERSETLSARGHFNPQLLRRLKAVAIHMPPLRYRKDDIALLARHFIGMGVASENRGVCRMTDQAMQYLTAGSWPGNVRQLHHLIWRAMILCQQEVIDAADLRLLQKPQMLSYDGMDMVSGPLMLDTEGRMKKLKSIEEEVIRFALRYYGGCMTRAARSLGIGRSTLYRRVNELESNGYISRANHTTRPMMKVSSIERS